MINTWFSHLYIICNRRSDIKVFNNYMLFQKWQYSLRVRDSNAVSKLLGMIFLVISWLKLYWGEPPCYFFRWFLEFGCKNLSWHFTTIFTTFRRLNTYFEWSIIHSANLQPTVKESITAPVFLFASWKDGFFVWWSYLFLRTLQSTKRNIQYYRSRLIWPPLNLIFDINLWRWWVWLQ